MTKTDLLKRLDDVINKGHATVASAPPPPKELDADHMWVSADLASQFRTAGLGILGGLLGNDHILYRDFEQYTNNKNVVSYYKKARALVITVRELIDNGWLDDTRALIAADIFTNILEMADYLLGEGYKDAAAVLVGGSLEGHLKQLASRHNIDLHFVDNKGGRQNKKAESLNAELHKADVYKLGDSKQITAWLDLRNNAAHGHYALYEIAEVRLMSQGVQNFIVRVPG